MKKPNIVFISHGGGPMPLFNDPQHADLVRYLKALPSKFDKPKAILVVSAHWEASVASITAHANPTMIYDYRGFPAESYNLQYPSPGEPLLAQQVLDALQQANIPAALDYQRGYDHGLYVPLMLMYPDADIPCIQLSLVNNLSAEQHLAIGKALQALEYDNLLIIGSGFTFHNMREFFTAETTDSQMKNQQFEHWLQATLTDKKLDETQRYQRMLNWQQAPFARYCQPREEHLLPLHVCYAMAGRASDEHDFMTVLNKQSSAYVWFG